jgi:hypothetical protein
MPTKKTKHQEARTQRTIRAKWFPVYGIRLEGYPYLFLSAETPEKAMIRLAAFQSDQGRKENVDLTVRFVNEPFEIE